MPIELDITNDIHWHAIQSIKRLTILGRLGLVGPQTVTDLATAMGETHQSTAYHVRLLERANLIWDIGKRKSTGRRQAALFALSQNTHCAQLHVDPKSELAMHRVDKLTRMITRYSLDLYSRNADAIHATQMNEREPLLNCAHIAVTKKNAQRIESLARAYSEAIDKAREELPNANEDTIPMMYGIWMTPDLTNSGPMADLQVVYE